MAYTIPPECDQQCRQALKDLREAEDLCRRAMLAGYDFTGQQTQCQYYRELLERTLSNLATQRRE
jgi:hypothetical protein